MSTEVELEIEEPPEKPDADRARGSRAVTLVVGHGHLRYIDRARRAVLVDFARRRRLTIDEVAGTFTDDSLFAEVGLRHAEMPNREHIRKTLERGGGDGSFFAPLQVEHQLSLRNPKRATSIAVERGDAVDDWRKELLAFWRGKTPALPRADIVVREGREEVVYEASARRLVARALDGFDASPRGLVHFLRFRFGGHPLILDEIAKLPFIPRQISVHGLNPTPFDGGPVTVKVHSARSSAGDWPAVTTGLREVVDLDGEEAGDSVLACARQATAAPSAVVEERLAAALSLARAGSVLAGALRFFELTLEAQVALPPEMAAALRASSDKRVAALLDGLRGVKDAVSARQVLALHAELRETVGPGYPALDAFEAEVRLAIGEVKEGKRLLGRALAANPRLVGAYATLGDLYLGGFDGRRAWRCWDAARSLCPSHPVLQKAAAIEETLLRLHPEYFGD